MTVDLSEALREGFNSKYRPHVENHKGYLGMSIIGGCPAAAYDGYFERQAPDQRLLWYGWVGRALEAGLVGILNISTVVIPRDHYMYNIEAKFDPRYRGHPDIILAAQGGLHVIDVKSVDWRKFEEILQSNKHPYSHEKNLAQVQSYIGHGNFFRGHIIYTPRDIPHGAWSDELLQEKPYRSPMPYHVVEVLPDLDLQRLLDEKAADILRCIDARKRPICICGWCDPPPIEEDEVQF